MNEKELISKITKKKEFSDLPQKDVEIILGKYEKRNYVDEEKIKMTRDLLRKVYSVYTSNKLLNKKILDKKTSEEILKKHISTRERYNFYGKLYERLLKGFEKEVSVVDLGSGINGLSFEFFPKKIKINYLGIEAVGQLVELANFHFNKKGIKNAKSIHESLYDTEKILNLIKKTKSPRIVFLFKVVDSLEMVKKDFSKELIREIVPFVEKIVVSFATESLVSRKKFRVKRYWFENFIGEEFKILEDFKLVNERYIVFRGKKHK